MKINLPNNFFVSKKVFTSYEIIPVSLFFLIISSIWTYPLLVKFSTSLLGAGGDRYIFLWNFWWFDKIIFKAPLKVLSCPVIYYPYGANLAYHSFSLFNCIIAFFFHHFLNLKESFNLLYFLSYPLAGITMYTFCRMQHCSPASSLVSGLIFTCWGGHWGHGEQINMSSIQWIPLFFLFQNLWFQRISRDTYNFRKSVLNSFLTFFLWLINGLTNWYYGFFLVFAGIITFLMNLILPIFNCKRKIFLKRFILTGFVGIIPIAIILILIYGSVFNEILDEGINNTSLAIDSAKVTIDSLLIPNASNPFTGHIVRNLYKSFSFSIRYGFEGTVFFGYLTLVLAFFGFKSLSIARKILWGTMFFFFLTFSLGTSCELWNYKIPFLLPYKFLEHIPFIAFLRVPSRAIIISQFVIAMFAGKGLSKIIETKSQFYSSVIFASAIIILLSEYAIFPTIMLPAPHIPKTYEKIAELSDDNAILTLSDQANEARKAMFFQTVHNHPITLGFTSHTNSNAYEVFNIYAILEQLLREKPPPPIKCRINYKKSYKNKNKFDKDKCFVIPNNHLDEILHSLNIGWVALYPNFWIRNNPRNVRILTKELGQELEYEPYNKIHLFEVPNKKIKNTYVFLGNNVAFYKVKEKTIVCQNKATIIVLSPHNWKKVTFSFIQSFPLDDLDLNMYYVEKKQKSKGIKKTIPKLNLTYYFSVQKGLNRYQLVVPEDKEKVLAGKNKNRRNKLFTIRLLYVLFQ